MLKIKTGVQLLEEVLNNFTQENLDQDLTSIINKWKELLNRIPFKFTIRSELWTFTDSIFATLYQTWGNDRTIYKCGSKQDIQVVSQPEPEISEEGLHVTPSSVFKVLTTWYNEVTIKLSLINSILDNPNRDIFDRFNLKPENIILRETKLFSDFSKPSDIIFLFGYFDQEINKEVFVEIPVYLVPKESKWSCLFGVSVNENVTFKVPHVEEIFKEIKAKVNEPNNVATGRIDFDPATDNTTTVELSSGSYWYWFMLNQE